MLVIAVPLPRPPQTLPPPRPLLQPPPPPYLPLPTPPLNYVSGPVYIYIYTTLLPSVNTIALEMFCGAKYTRHTFTPVTEHGGKMSLIKKYVRNQTDTKHIKIASLQGLLHKSVCPNKSDYKNYLHQITRPAYSRGPLSCHDHPSL